MNVSSTRRRLGGTHSADLLIRSYDFAAIEELQERDDWDGAGALLAQDAAWLQAAGAELILLCTNTMHRVADAIEAAVTVPFLHLADATAAAVQAAGVRKVVLLGTRYTMEHDFYRGRSEEAGLDVRVPAPTDRAMVHRVIYEELVRGEVLAESRRRFVDLIDGMVADGAEGVIAGCTEIELLVTPEHVSCPYFPTTSLHAMAAVEAALA